MIALGTADFKWEIVKLSCILLMLLGFILGPYFMIRWRRARKSVEEVVLRIKDRIPPDTTPTPETYEIRRRIDDMLNAIVQREADIIEKHLKTANSEPEK